MTNSSRQLAASPSPGPRSRRLRRFPLIVLGTVLLLQDTSGASAGRDVPHAASPDTGPAAVERASVATQQAVRLDPPAPRISVDYVSTDLGCARGVAAAELESFFAGRVGPIIGHDSPRVYPLGDGRFLWLLQDSFVDYAGTAVNLADSDYTHSTALIQQGSCFTMFQRGTRSWAWSFEPGEGEFFQRFFWPVGGAVDGARIRVFWTEIHRDSGPRGPLDGVGWHPVATWLGTYDIKTLQRLDFRLAPNPGVSPVYGFGVTSDGSYSYLFGNSFQQNLALEGGYANGPHSATKMWLARVPDGRLDLAPEYRTATGWSTDQGEAHPISSRYWTENAMMPELINGRWVSTTKIDGYVGSHIAIDVADDPWGPWTTVKTIPAEVRGDPAMMVTYHAIPMPWLDPGGGLIVSLSQNHVDWSDGGQPDKYRPRYFDVPLPP